MSSIEGIDKIGEQASKIQIQGPQNGQPDERSEIEAAIADARADLPKRDSDWHLVTEDGETADITEVRQTEAFDGSAYIAVPEVDGQTTDKLVIAFSGAVAYDASDEEGAKLFQDLALGKAVELRVAGYVSGKQGTYKVTATEEEVVTGKAIVKVDTLYLLTPEALS